jgi:AcrR family transcriptional regulator
MGLFVRRAARIDVNAFYMSWSKDRRDGGPRGYHHGDLRETLIRAALELIAQKGSAGFTFADAARWAGVSPAAPYRHFRDRDDLLANVALRGFEQFETALASAWDDGRPDALTALDRMGKAYLGFARAEPAYYSAMFESGIAPDTSPELRAASDRAFSVLRLAAEKVCAQAPPRDRPPALMLALHIWAMAHGIASLFGRGDSARRTVPMAPEDLLEAAVLIYLKGLGVGVGAGPGPGLGAASTAANRPSN